MILSLFSSLLSQLRNLLLPATPLVPAGPAMIGRPVIIDCAFIDVPLVAPAAISPEIAPASVSTRAAAAPVVQFEEEERVVIATIATHAAAIIATPRREPEDFLLARRLRSVAVLNRPSAAKVLREERPALKRRSPGPLSPVLARGRSASRIASWNHTDPALRAA